MSRIEWAINALDGVERKASRDTPLHRIDARAKLLATLLLMLYVLSLGAAELPQLVLSCALPIFLSAWGRVPYGWLFLRSSVVLPFVGLIGIFNLWLERETAFYIGDFPIAVGWLSFVAILLRALVTTQLAILLIVSTGFHRLCVSLRLLGVPSLLAFQLWFVYRYLFVLLQEALSMERARASRSYGRRSYPLKQWGVFVGQLLLRTVNRSERIHRAMLSRGFDGTVPMSVRSAWQWQDTRFLLSAFLVMALLFFSSAVIDVFLTLL